MIEKQHAVAFDMLSPDREHHLIVAIERLMQWAMDAAAGQVAATLARGKVRCAVEHHRGSQADMSVLAAHITWEEDDGA